MQVEYAQGSSLTSASFFRLRSKLAFLSIARDPEASRAPLTGNDLSARSEGEEGEFPAQRVSFVITRCTKVSVGGKESPSSSTSTHAGPKGKGVAATTTLSDLGRDKM